MIYSNGDEYQGKWFMDQQSGLGVMRYSNGDIYDGNWLQNKKSSLGKMTYTNLNIIYDGNWYEDYISEEGELTIIDPFTHEISLKTRFVNGSKIIRKVNDIE